MSSSDFSERLKAMKEGRSAGTPFNPSLKDRLNQGAPSEVRNPSNDIKAKIQAKFQKKPEQEAAKVRETVAALEPQQDLPQFEMGKIPEAKQAKDQNTNTWTIDDGGFCPSCGTYNNSMMAFCQNCDYMLVKSEQSIEVITSYSLKEMKGLVQTFVDKLAKLNIKTTEDILRIGANAKNRQTLIKHTSMSERSLVRLVHQADICRVPSMGPENAAMLELLGINTLADMLKWKPLDLYNKVQQSKIKLNQTGIMFLPTKGQVNIWFEEAANLAPIKIQ